MVIVHAAQLQLTLILRPCLPVQVHMRAESNDTVSTVSQELVRGQYGPCHFGGIGSGCSFVHRHQPAVGVKLMSQLCLFPTAAGWSQSICYRTGGIASRKWTSSTA